MSCQASNEKNPGYLLYIGDYTTQLHGDYTTQLHGDYTTQLG